MCVCGVFVFFRFWVLWFGLGFLVSAFRIWFRIYVLIASEFRVQGLRFGVCALSALRVRWLSASF